MELIGISGSNHVDEAQAATQLSGSANQFPQGTRLGIRWLVPPVVDDRGHIPDLLQDFLLQIYAGFHVASELDVAVTTFRANGTWPASLLQLPADARNPLISQTDATNQAQQSLAPPGNQVPPPPTARAIARLCVTHLHQHPCEQAQALSAVLDAGAACAKSNPPHDCVSSMLTGLQLL